MMNGSKQTLEEGVGGGGVRGSADPWTFPQDHPLQRGKEIKFTPFFTLLTGRIFGHT